MFTDLPNGVVQNVIAALLIIVAGFVVRRTYSLIATRRERRRALLRESWGAPPYSASFLRRYYRSQGELASLHRVLTASGWVTIPILRDLSWLGDPVLLEEELVVQERYRRSEVGVNRKILQARRRIVGIDSPQGQLWNDDLLYVRRLSLSPSGPRLSLGVATYFQYLSACGSLEDETGSSQLRV